MDNGHKILGGLFAVAVIIIILMRSCNSHKCPDAEILEVDTVLNETIYDTNWFDSTKFKYITVKIPKPYYDTIPIPMPVDFDGLEEDFILKYASIYMDTIKNDTISMFYRAKVRGYLDELKLGYKIFTPFYIEKTTTIQTEVVKKKRFNGIYFGMDVGVGKDGLSHLSPILEASFRQFNCEVGFDLNNKDVVFGVKARIGKK